MTNSVALAILAAVGVLLIFIGLGSGKKKTEEQTFVEDEYGTHLVSKTDSSVINAMLAEFSQKIKPSEGNLETRLRKSGWVYKSEIEYHAKRMSQAVLFLFLVLGVGMVMHMNFFTVAVLATAAAIGGFILPDQKINSATKKRKETIEREMGFGLERISLSLTSGTNLTTALSNAKGVGTFGNICETLASCINTNQNINEVIKVIKDDLPNMSLMNEFLELVRQSIIKGQNIAKAFQTTAEILRDRLELEIIDAGGKAKIKITLLTSTFLVASSLIVAIGPIAITIMNLM